MGGFTSLWHSKARPGGPHLCGQGPRLRRFRTRPQRAKCDGVASSQRARIGAQNSRASAFFGGACQTTSPAFAGPVIL